MTEGVDEIAQAMKTEIRNMAVTELMKMSASCCEKGVVLHIMCKECHATVVTVGE